MPETPHGRFEYPTKAYPAWFEKGAVIDADGRDIEQEFDGIVNWLEQLEISVAGEVQTTDDLPAPDETITNPRTGEHRVYLVADEEIFYYDTGTEWTPIGLQSLPIEDSGLALGDATTLNFSNQISASISGDGETVRIDAEIDDHDIAPNAAYVDVDLQIPVYSSTADANTAAEGGNLIYITGSGSESAGIYYYDGSQWDVLEAGSSGAGTLSELSINTDKNWNGYSISNLGNVDADGVSASSTIDIPVYDGSDPSGGNFWIRSDR